MERDIEEDDKRGMRNKNRSMNGRNWAALVVTLQNKRREMKR